MIDETVHIREEQKQQSARLLDTSEISENNVKNSH